MKQYVVSEELLGLAKQLIQDWPTHDVHCAYHTVDICDCGLASLRRRYRKECESIKPAIPEEELYRFYKNVCSTRLVSFEEFKKNYYNGSN